MANDNKLVTLEDLKAAFDDVDIRAGVTGVKGKAESTYRTGNVNLTPANIGALALTGGTVTGNIMHKSSGVDASKADNGISSSLYPTTFYIRDDSGRTLARLEGQIMPGGNIGSKWYVRNYDTSGNQVGNKGIGMTMNKAGELTYTFDDAANARSALGIQYKFYRLPSQLGLSGTNTVLQIFNALPDNSVIVTSTDLDASDMPSDKGELMIWRIGNSRTHIMFYCKLPSDGTWRMYLGGSAYNGNVSNAPDGTWHRVYDGSTVVPLSAGGTGGIGLVTVSATVSIPSVAAGGTTELSFSNPDSSKYKLLCISGWNLTNGFVPYVVGVHAGGSTALSRLNVRNVTSSALSGTAVIQWLAVQLN